MGFVLQFKLCRLCCVYFEFKMALLVIAEALQRKRGVLNVKRYCVLIKSY